MKTLPTTRAAQLAPSETSAPEWLIEGLWSREAVGIIGGEPKCGKSLLALDLAVAVASGTPCLRRFPTKQSGAVLLYAAEDAWHIVRQRLEGIACAAGVNFEKLEVEVITVPTLRLDRSEYQQALEMTVAHLEPKLLVLDPFVRLQRITSALCVPASSASAHAASTATSPSLSTAVSRSTIWRSPSFTVLSFSCTRPSAPGNSQPLNGAPFRSAPGFLASTGT